MVDTAVVLNDIGDNQETEIIMEPDGSVIINVGPEDSEEPEFEDNLIEYMESEDVEEIASDLIDGFKNDIESRKDWEATYKEGIEILGLKLEDVDYPFPGACAAHHPMMLEAALQFQARAISELFPAGGPVKSKLMGTASPETLSQADRVRDYMNYQLTEEMEEYFDELDTMLFHLPLSGSTFKKTYYDYHFERPVSKYVPAEDFVISYHTTDLKTSPRFCHIIRMDENEVRRHQVSGFYVDIDLEEPKNEKDNQVREAKEDIVGIKRFESKGTRKLLEFHVDLDIEGFEDLDSSGEPTGIKLPYVVTIDESTEEVLSIRRNYEENDPKKQKLMWFTHYKFLPGLGFYGMGLPHILGNLQKTSTAILRSLVDAGQFANLPAGFKARGVRIDGGDTPLSFGEFRDVEGYGDDLNKAIITLPVKEPSQTLFLLLGRIIDDSRRLASVSDMNVSDMNSEAPVGTTLAMMEQGVKVMSAIHKRLHRAQRMEFKILSRINRDFLPEEYPYDVEGGTRSIFKADFDSRVDVLPVSDPNTFSESQRILRAQTQLQLATQLPQQHDLRVAVRRMHEALGTLNIEEVLAPERGAKPMDPATELFTVMNGNPIKAYAYQDHNAHAQSHMAQLQIIQGMAMQNPALQQVIPMLLAHVAEHQAYMIRQQVEAVSNINLNPAPDYDKSNPSKNDEYVTLDPEVETFIAQKQALAMQQLAQQAAQMAQMQQQQQAAQDPTMQIAQAKLQLDGAKLQADVQSDQQKLAQKNQEHQDKLSIEVAKLQQKGQLDREQMRADLATVIANRGSQ